MSIAFIVVSIRGVSKIANWFGFGFEENRTVQKFDIHFGQFSDRNCVQFAIQIKSDKR